MFRVPSSQPPEPHKMAKYECHMILNRAAPDLLTKLARNPYLNIPSVNQIWTTKTDRTCTEYMKGRLKRAPHKRKEHKYKRDEAVSTDIMGPLRIPGMPQPFQKYFISFTEVSTRYEYVH